MQIGDILDLIWLVGGFPVGTVDFFTTCFSVKFPRMHQLPGQFSNGDTKNPCEFRITWPHHCH